MKIFFITIIGAFIFSSDLYSQCGPVFYDGFESGAYTPTWNIGAGLTSGAVTTTSPAVGTYRLEGYGGTSTHLTGFSTTIAPATPPTISWWINPQGAVATNYFLAGNSSISATNCIVFCYWQGGTNIRFVSSTTYQFPTVANQWYHIEMRNINWGAHTFDIYIDNVLHYTSFPFRSATQNDVSNIHLYNFGNGTGIWDEVIIGDGSPLVLSNTSTDALCNGSADGSIDLTSSSGNPGPLSFNWNTGPTTEDLSGIPAGVYSVIVTDSIGCSDSITNITISEPAAIGASFNFTEPDCNNGSNGSANINATGGTPGYTYLWSTLDNTPAIANLSAGTYICTITDTNNCIHVDSLMVTEPAPINFLFSATNPSSCGGNEGSIDATISGGTPGYSFNWSNGPISEDNFALFEGSYTLTVTDTNGCTDSSSVTLTDPTPTSVTLSIPEDSVCINHSSFALTGSSIPGGTYSGPGVSANNFDPGIAGIGSSAILYTYTDPNNCISTATDNIIVSSCLGVEPNQLNGMFNIYPNPASEYFHISNTTNTNEYTWELCNDLGQIIRSGKLTGENYQIDVSTFQPGIYLLIIKNETEKTTSKLIIQ